MAGMAAAMRTVTGPVSVKQIRDVWHDVSVSLPERKVAEAIRSLTNREVITGDRTYSFAVYLQRLWLDRHRRLDWVKEELAQALREWDQQSRFSPSPRRRTAIMLAATAVVVVLAAGVAWQLTRPGHPVPPSAHTATRSTTRAVPKSSTTPTSTASGSTSVVIGPGAAHQVDVGQIAAFVESYFKAINNRNYQGYINLFDKEGHSPITEQEFLANYSSTTDSNATVVALSSTAAGDRAATVTFDSHEAPSTSSTHTACVRWRIILYLEPKGTTYLIVPAPPGYKASFRRCS